MVPVLHSLILLTAEKGLRDNVVNREYVEKRGLHFRSNITPCQSLSKSCFISRHRFVQTVEAGGNNEEMNLTHDKGLLRRQK